MRTVFFTPQARDDLDDITLYIARESLEAAQRFLDCARSTTDQLARQPGLGHRRPDRSPRGIWRLVSLASHVTF